MPIPRGYLVNGSHCYYLGSWGSCPCYYNYNTSAILNLRALGAMADILNQSTQVKYCCDFISYVTMGRTPHLSRPLSLSLSQRDKTPLTLPVSFKGDGNILYLLE